MDEYMTMPMAAPMVASGSDDTTGIGQTTEVSWVAPADMTFDQWSGVGSTFQQISRSINWWIGDWLNAGEMLWGEMATQAVEETGRGVDSLLKCKAVSQRFKPESRIESLSWSHHRAVCYLEESERDEWMGAALSYQIATRELNVIARFDRSQRHRLLDAANRGVSLSEFTRLFELVRLDRDTDSHHTVVSGKHRGEEYPGQFDEEEDGLPFDELRADGSKEWADEIAMDIEDVFGYFERLGAPLKVVHVAEAIWEGMSVRAEVNQNGEAHLIWEEVP